MALEADGSNPSIHPSCMAENQARTVPRRFWLLFTLACIYGGMSPSGKARDFDSRIRGFESRHPSIFDLLAQSAEHLPFKQGVRGSNPRRSTKYTVSPFGLAVYFIPTDFEPRTPKREAFFERREAARIKREAAAQQLASPGFESPTEHQ